MLFCMLKKKPVGIVGVKDYYRHVNHFVVAYILAVQPQQKILPRFMKEDTFRDFIETKEGFAQFERFKRLKIIHSRDYATLFQRPLTIHFKGGEYVLNDWLMNECLNRYMVKNIPEFYGCEIYWNLPGKTTPVYFSEVGILGFLEEFMTNPDMMLHIDPYKKFQPTLSINTLSGDVYPIIEWNLSNVPQLIGETYPELHGVDIMWDNIHDATESTMSRFSEKGIHGLKEALLYKKGTLIIQTYYPEAPEEEDSDEEEE